MLIRFEATALEACSIGNRLLFEGGLLRSGRPLRVLEIVGVTEGSADFSPSAVLPNDSEDDLLTRCQPLTRPGGRNPLRSEWALMKALATPARHDGGCVDARSGGGCRLW